MPSHLHSNSTLRALAACFAMGISAGMLAGCASRVVEVEDQIPKTVVASPAPPTPAPSPLSAPSIPQRQATTTIIVAPGDTLSSIAQKHRIGVGELMRANSLTSEKIVAGQRLIIPSA